MLELKRKQKKGIDSELEVFDWEGELPKFKTRYALQQWVEEHRYEDVLNPFSWYGIEHIPDEVVNTRLNPGVFSSGDLEGSYEWGTPQEIFDEYNARHNYDVDLAASCLNAKHPTYLGPGPDIITDYLQLCVNAKNSKGAVRKQYKVEAQLLLRENDMDALNIDWHKHFRCGWLNPPYGSLCGEFVAKAYDEVNLGMACVTMLLPARTDTQWFHNYVYKAMKNKGGGTQCSTVFIEGRLAFTFNGEPQGTAPFPSMICHFSRYRSPYTQGGL